VVVYASEVFLKTLTIKGFKSFADSTVLHFEPGVTVIVGPNGSGKSNIVDAVAWVLGSQSPSTIRSSKMDDVIFAGTAKRPALGRAEVALTIDNATGVLPIDFTEVTISRTLFRNGDSEYQLNGVPCRLLDIQELLSDTGVGRHQHVIVSQGHLDAILQARPEDRRYVIEEAAGVLKYRRRREKAQRRLEATEANLLRLNDLLREVRRQLRPLERQADAARRHGTLVEELRAIRLHLVGHELASQKTRLARALQEKRDLHEQETGARSRLTELDSQVMRAEVELTTQGQSETSDQLMRVESLRQRARGLLAVLQERKRSIERELDAFLDQELIASLEADANRLKDQLRSVEHEAAELMPRANELSDEERSLEEARAKFETEWGDFEAGADVEAAERRGELNILLTELARENEEKERLLQTLRTISLQLAGVNAVVEEELQRLLSELSDQIRRNQLRIEEIRKMQPVVEAEQTSSVGRSQHYREARAVIEERAGAIVTLRTDLEVRAAGIDERRNFITARLSEIMQRLDRHQDEREAAAQRRQLIDARATATEKLSELIEERVLNLDILLVELQAARSAETARVRETADALDGLRRDRSAAERQLSDLQSRTQRLQIEEAECDVRIESLIEQIRNEFDEGPEVAMAAQLPELDPGVDPKVRAQDLEKELKIMGPINPLALEEFESLSERSQFLETQLEDVKNSRKELQKVIREVDVQIVQVFTAAYADVSANFTKLFEMLFPGGSGQIRLTEPDNLLETGIEIEARPGGKNLRKLSLLSGGERSLTALAFLFAVFRSRPSPFYLLDEVEAALDDVNLQRFLQLVEEFRSEAQLMIVSHQKRTMEAADALYGVSMKPGESSKVISERIRGDQSVSA
jgi:chromosome segregation ATPase